MDGHTTYAVSAQLKYSIQCIVDIPYSVALVWALYALIASVMIP